jgi:hypothetical protein
MLAYYMALDWCLQIRLINQSHVSYRSHPSQLATIRYTIPIATTWPPGVRLFLRLSV